jgi:hypothetical protein
VADQTELEDQTCAVHGIGVLARNRVLLIAESAMHGANLHDANGAAHSGPSDRRNRDCSERRGHRHARDFSLKVPAKPIMKIGDGMDGAARSVVDPQKRQKRQRPKIHTWLPCKFRH